MSFLCHICRGAGARDNRGGGGAGGVRETGEERAESVISSMAGSGREIQKGKFLLFVTAYIQPKKRTQQRFLTSIQRSPRLKAKFYTREKSKTKGRTRGKKIKKGITFCEIEDFSKSLTS